MLIRGTFLDLPKLGEVSLLSDYILAVDSAGFITHSEHASSPKSQNLLHTHRDLADSLITIPNGTFILPNFCDLHLHAPQFLYQGTGLHLPLMQWLDEYAFQAEERLDADPVLARKVYTRLADRLIENGTGAVSLFGTIKEETNLILAEVMQKAGIRAFVGKLSMDISSRPTYVEKSAESALSSARSFVNQCRRLVSHLPSHRRLVQPILTPRFVPTCSDDLLSGLGKFSNSESLRIQSHLAEAHDQVDWVRRERGIEDIEVFDRHNLLTPRTIQAHCTFLDTPDLFRVASKGTAIAHCPLSNAYFSAEPFHLREALHLGVKVGLGTDVAGGYSIDIMNTMRQAITVSRMREGQRTLSQHPTPEDEEQNFSLDWKEALYLATRGGMHALGLSGGGGFDVGSPFDAQQISIFDAESGRGIGALDFLDLEAAITSGGSGIQMNVDMFEKWWCLGDSRNRVGMWVQGTPLTRDRRQLNEPAEISHAQATTTARGAS